MYIESVSTGNNHLFCKANAHPAFWVNVHSYVHSELKKVDIRKGRGVRGGFWGCMDVFLCICIGKRRAFLPCPTKAGECRCMFEMWFGTSMYIRTLMVICDWRCCDGKFKN